MYAVIKTGGKQYRVAPGEKLKVEQIPSDIGAVITLEHVLAVGDGEKSLIGEPIVDGAAVSATVLDQGKHKKVRIFKLRRRKHYRKTQGHRQTYTELFVSKIESPLGAEEADATEAMAYSQMRRDRLAIAQGVGKASLTAGWDAARGKAPEGLTAVADTGDSTAVAGLAAAPAAVEQAGATDKPDDLTKVEGIGPKIAEHLQSAGIASFADLAAADQAQLQKVLDDAGPRYSIHKPDTWPEQAALAAAGKWDELDKLKDELDGGKRA